MEEDKNVLSNIRSEICLFNDRILCNIIENLSSSNSSGNSSENFSIHSELMFLNIIAAAPLDSGGLGGTKSSIKYKPLAFVARLQATYSSDRVIPFFRVTTTFP